MNKKSEIGIFFIHGAGLYGQIWQKVTEHLKFPFMCADYSSIHNSKHKEASLSDYVTLAYNQAVSLNTNKIVVVGHSIGGVVGVEVMKQLDNRVAGFIGVSAAIPKPGKNFVTTLSLPQKIIMPVMLRIAGTKPPESAIVKGLCLDLTKEQSEKIAANYKREAIGLFLDKTSHIDIPSVPTFYIKTLKDKEFKPKIQDTSIKKLHNAKIFTIDSGHMPMVSHPKLVANYIKKAVEQIG